jgi:hypothetical protein
MGRLRRYALQLLQDVLQRDKTSCARYRLQTLPSLTGRTADMQLTSATNAPELWTHSAYAGRLSQAFLKCDLAGEILSAMSTRIARMKVAQR